MHILMTYNIKEQQLFQLLTDANVSNARELPIIPYSSRNRSKSVSR